MNPSEVFAWDDNCPIYQLFDVLGKKWMLYIILTIKQDINSFSLIMKRLPKLNSKILSERIDTLMEKGIITRDVSQSKPLRITYHLTEKGVRIVQKIDELGILILNSNNIENTLS